MTILVTGSTGTIGSLVVAGLAQKQMDVRALVRDPAKAKFANTAKVVQGDMMDIQSMRAALAGVSTLFLLNAVTPDEVTQALITLNLARAAGVKNYVYFSVFNSHEYTEVPHFGGKYVIERMIEQFDLAATIMRPSYFMQNDLTFKDALLGPGIYPMAIGSKGLGMIDTRDVADVAVTCLIKRETQAATLPRETFNVVGPEVHTGATAAASWGDALGRAVAYGGDDLIAFEQQLGHAMPGWMAYDLCLMLNRFQRDGNIPLAGDQQHLEALLGRPLRRYRDFVAETVKLWRAPPGAD